MASSSTKYLSVQIKLINKHQIKVHLFGNNLFIFDIQNKSYFFVIRFAERFIIPLKSIGSANLIEKKKKLVIGACLSKRCGAIELMNHTIEGI